VARLKNSADFLEICVKAFLPYLDEVILVAEKSTDNTSEICEKLVREHPDKIKYFYYEYEVFFRNSEQPMPPTNSVHSFAYFTNYAFSKTSYQYVMRLDDDILPIPKFWKNLKNIYINNTGKYLLYH
jgi:glycosyltransferase involved in cell wall biosynthesis